MKEYIILINNNDRISSVCFQTLRNFSDSAQIKDDIWTLHCYLFQATRCTIEFIYLFYFIILNSNSCILNSNSCILNINSCILYSISCILIIKFCILKIIVVFCYSSSCILNSNICILIINSCILNSKSCILLVALVFLTVIVVFWIIICWLITKSKNQIHK